MDNRPPTTARSAARAVERVGTDREHGTRRVAHDVIGHRTEDRPLEAARATRPEDDEPDLPLAGVPADLAPGVAFQHHGLGTGETERVAGVVERAGTVGHIDLSTAAFDRIGRLQDGIIPITWKLVSPETMADDIAFHFKDDLSYRQVDIETPTSSLRATHFAYDLTDARADPNVVFPLDTLKKCVSEGIIGELSNPAYTFMGGIYSSRKVRDILAPALADALQKDEVDVALMVPV